MSIYQLPLRFRRESVILLLAGLAFLTGCGVDHERDATELADRVYQRIAEDDFEGAAALYSDSFYERVPRERWVEALRQVRNTLGPYEGHSLIEARDHTFGPDDDSGEVFTVLMVRVEYAEDDAVEQLTFRRTTPETSLVNHQVMSDAVAVNFDDAENPVRIASVSDDETGSTPAEDPEVAPEPQEEPDETPTEIARVEESPEPRSRESGSPEPVSESESVEERIAEEIRRLRSRTTDSGAEQLVAQLVINAIHPGRDRILIETRLLERGDPVSREHSVVLQSVEPRRIFFQDETGTVYEKAFLTSEP